MKSQNEIEKKLQEIYGKFQNMNESVLMESDLEEYYGLEYGLYILKWILDIIDAETQSKVNVSSYGSVYDNFNFK